MRKISNSLLIILLMLGSSVFSQKILLDENFVKPLKWKASNNANGSMTFEKEGSESVMKVEAVEDKMFTAILKLPALQATTTKVLLEYVFFLTEKFNAHVIFGEKPNRLVVNSDGTKGLRLSGESIQSADGAKFMTISTNAWHKMQIVYDFKTKLARFTLDAKESKELDLNLQPDKAYLFNPSVIEVRAFKGGVIKVKAIKITEL